MNKDCLEDAWAGCNFGISNAPEVDEDRIITSLQHIEQQLLRMEKNQQRLFDFMVEVQQSIDVDPSKWADILQLQKIINRSRSTIYRYINEGILNPIKSGRKFMFYLPDILDRKDHYLK